MDETSTEQDETNTEQQEQPTEQKPDKEQPEQKPEKTFTRDDVNRMIAAEKKKEREAVETEFQSKQAEADKLAKMKEDERVKYEKEQAEKKAQDALSELNAYKLKDEAIKVANTEGLPIQFLDLIDLGTATAEKLNDTIANLSKTFKSAVEEALNAKLKQPSPETHHDGSKTTKADFDKMSYKDQLEFKAKYPDLYKTFI
ncbi:MAG TPA: hypothetical protein DEP23_01460 [Ruminococcaceae bacterium]|nr:hypothetical protein [Oscillospiraceae bacterium]